MDFAGPLSREESVTTRSKIRHIPVAQSPPDSVPSLDERVVQAANTAARDLFRLGSGNPEQDADSSIYVERLKPLQNIIKAGDLVVIMESFDNLNFVYAEEGGILHNRNGHFRHDDFIGKPFGCKIRSFNNRGYGFLYLLKPTPELWARSLNHRTQIVHELDQSQIIFQLHLRPNMVVVESGTGSGAMSHGILRTIAPLGHLHTYEFNELRAKTAQQEFEKNGVGSLVTVRHRDVCDPTEGGFDLPGASVDALFLDVPAPWLAVPHAAHVLKPNARIATYSPCVEQTQKTIEALKKCGFHSVKTMEFRLQEHYVDEVEYGPPPATKRPCLLHRDFAEERAATNGGAGASTTDSGNSEKMNVSPDEDAAANVEQKIAAEQSDQTTKKRKQLVARPFVSMRGHSAFLTFATAGNKAQPNPIKK